MTDKTIYDALWINACIATMKGDGYGMIQKGAIAVKDGHIAWVGAMSGDSDSVPVLQAHKVVDAEGGLITPALIDCHTHLIYGGDRAAEFEQRLNGATYEDIAKAGGGILSTVRATRAASEEDLYAQALRRLTILRKGGVGVFEIKSGYGLDLASEEKMLRVATRLRDETGLSIQRTFLGAHALPPEFTDNAEGYIDHVCRDMIPSFAKAELMDAVDVFCERIAFSAAQAQRVFEAAQAAGLPVKIHAEQLSNMGGAALAARYQALSADHLEYLDEDGVRAMAEQGSVAVLLPGAFYTIKETQKPPIELLRRYGVAMALATDHNPGSSPALSLVLMMNMGCTFFGMTPLEALRGVTVQAARALGVSDRFGVLEVGRDADFVLWDAAQPADLSYRFGHAPVRAIIRQGAVLSL